MKEYKSSGQEGKTVFVGVDLHRFKWHVTVRTNYCGRRRAKIIDERLN
jgi:hypothetical protein